MTARPIAFYIHDLNTWGGQDRSTLEIIRQLDPKWRKLLRTYTVEAETDAMSEHIRVRPHIKRPAIAKSALFHGSTLIHGVLDRFKEVRPLVHSTGTCSLISDIHQIQFVHSAWDEILRAHGKEIEGDSKDSFLRNFYRRNLLKYETLLERILYQDHKTYIALSHSVASDLKRLFGIKSNLHVIHHGIDSDAFAPAESASEKNGIRDLRDSLGIQTEDVVILFVGVYRRKGLLSSIKALSELSQEQRGKIKLMAVGTGDESYFKELARLHGLENQLILVGHQKSILRYYQASDIFLLPTWYEPFGLVILEAMSCGLAPVVSRCAGASELTKHEESSFLIQDPGDPREISTYLSTLVGNPSLRKEMGQRVRQIAVQNTWKKVAEKYGEVFQFVMERKSVN